MSCFMACFNGSDWVHLFLILCSASLLDYLDIVWYHILIFAECVIIGVLRYCVNFALQTALLRSVARGLDWVSSSYELK